jgi:hypothetical protein
LDAALLVDMETRYDEMITVLFPRSDGNDHARCNGRNRCPTGDHGHLRDGSIFRQQEKSFALRWISARQGRLLNSSDSAAGYGTFYVTPENNNLGKSEMHLPGLGRKGVLVRVSLIDGRY